MLYDAKGRPLLTVKERQEDLAKLKYMVEHLNPKAIKINGLLVDMKLSPSDAVTVLSIVLSHAVHQACGDSHLLIKKKMNEITRGILAMTDRDPEYRAFYDANYSGMDKDI